MSLALGCYHLGPLGGTCPGDPPGQGKLGVISNNGTAVFCLVASPQLHGGEEFSLAFIGATMQCCA